MGRRHRHGHRRGHRYRRQRKGHGKVSKPQPKQNILIRFLKWLFAPPRKCKHCGRIESKGFYVDPRGYCDNCRPNITIIKR
jgi:hypothetical protein